ncbi:hypothetical protein GGH92_003593 [Coemansia sp. RSA 2673]|nr:hypothetical protein GGH92_003593 [Coemansia sp. RSA 2673]
MLKHTQDGDAPGVPEVSHAQELEMTRTASSQESDSRGRVVVPQAQAIAALEQRIMALERKVAKIKPAYIGQRQTIATLERTVDALNQSLIGQQQTGISRDQVLATFSHALVTNQQANTTQQQTINTQQQTITEQRFQLENQARRIDASNLLLARATPLNAPATGTTTFGNAPAVGVPAFDISALVAPAAGAPTFGDALAVGISAFDVSAFVAPAAGAPTFGDALAVGVSAFDVSDLVAPAVSATTFGDALAVGVSAFDVSDLVAPAAGAPTFGDARAVGVSAFDVSAFVAPAAGAPTFGDARAISVSAFDVSDLVAPAVSATTFGDARAVSVSAFDVSDLVAPTAGVLDRDISALVAPAAGATMFGNAPTVGIPDLDISDFRTPAAGALAADVLAVNFSAFDTSAFVAPAVNVPVDATQATAIPNDNQPIGCHLAAQARVHRTPCNDAPESSLLAKRRRVDRHVSDSGTTVDPSCRLRDVSGRRVTSERLLVVFGASTYVSLGYIHEAYIHIYGCELMPRTFPPHEYIATLARVVALEHWAPHLEGEVFEDIAGRNILCRRDLELGALRQNYREQLGLADDPNAAVLGPRLCYVLVRMCSMSVDHLSAPVLRSMFMDATGLDLHTLNVVTEKGVQRMGANSIYQTVDSWVSNFCKFIAEEFSMDDARCAATKCNAAYTTRCGSASDSTSVASDMLKNNEDDSRLFLGNQAADLEEPSKRLLFVASRNTSTLVKDGLEQLAMPLRVQNDSS